MEFVVVRVIFEGIDGLLPVGRQDIAIVAIEPLTDLLKGQRLRIRAVNFRKPHISPGSSVEFGCRVTCLRGHL